MLGLSVFDNELIVFFLHPDKDIQHIKTQNCKIIKEIKIMKKRAHLKLGFLHEQICFGRLGYVYAILQMNKLVMCSNSLFLMSKI